MSMRLMGRRRTVRGWRCGICIPEARLVLAGINAGGNLGADVYVSGTVAAVREAALHRVLGIAVSHYRNGRREYDWGRAARLDGGGGAAAAGADGGAGDLLECEFAAFAAGSRRIRRWCFVRLVVSRCRWIFGWWGMS